MTTLKVPDMNCEHCVSRISKALEEQKLNFKVSLSDKTVDIDGDETAVKSAYSVLDDIGDNAFANCHNLKEVNLPDSAYVRHENSD